MTEQILPSNRRKEQPKRLEFPSIVEIQLGCIYLIAFTGYFLVIYPFAQGYTLIKKVMHAKKE